MPYRDRARGRVPSPDVDEQLFRTQWWLPLLVVSLVFIPPHLLLTWFDNQTVRCGGQAHPETFAEKIAFSVACALWLTGLLYARARHRRRLWMAVSVLHERTDASSGCQRVQDVEPPRRIGVGDDRDDPEHHEGLVSSQGGRKMTQ